VRVNAYIDGFNLYHGLHSAFRRKYLWLDVQKLASRFLRPGETLGEVRYFTALLRNDQPAETRQRTYLAALSATGVDVVLGRFQEKTARCFTCKAEWRTYEEKQSDVSLAVALVEDAANGNFEKAFLVSADSDLIPPIEAVRRVGGQSIVGLFPPKRNSSGLERHLAGVIRINETNLRQSQLPPTVLLPDGRKLFRPPHWMYGRTGRRPGFCCARTRCEIWPPLLQQIARSVCARATQCLS
jgi:uncharacterized LabA/DUF88 family protein